MASITILLYFFFVFLVILNNFFIIPVVQENTILKLALAIPTRTPTALAKEIIDIRPFFAGKTIKALSK